MLHGRLRPALKCSRDCGIYSREWGKTVNPAEKASAWTEELPPLTNNPDWPQALK